MTTGIGLGISRGDNETWLEAAVRLAIPHQQEDGVAALYRVFIQRGAEESEAALRACAAWGCAEVAETEDPEVAASLTVDGRIAQFAAQIEEQAKEHQHAMWGMTERVRELEDRVKEHERRSEEVERIRTEDQRRRDFLAGIVGHGAG